MTSQHSQLTDLVVDEDELNEELLSETLSPYVEIGGSSGGLYPTAAFEELHFERKTAIVLLGQRARHHLDMVEEDSLSPSEIAELCGMNKNTVYPAVSKLNEKSIAEKDDGRYRIPTPKLNAAKTFIQEGDD